MTDDRTYFGTAPASLRIERRANGDIRFRVTPLNGREAVVDIDGDQAEQLVAELSKRGES